MIYDGSLSFPIIRTARTNNDAWFHNLSWGFVVPEQFTALRGICCIQQWTIINNETKIYVSNDHQHFCPWRFFSLCVLVGVQFIIWRRLFVDLSTVRLSSRYHNVSPVNRVGLYNVDDSVTFQWKIRCDGFV